MSSSPQTLADKLWDRHIVRSAEGEPDLLYIDLHLVHEVTSPQAFDGLRLAGRPVRRPDLTIATADHNVPTINIDLPIADPISAKQVSVLSSNCAEFGIRLHPMGDPGQGIVHVIGPEFGLTQPGMTIVCGDSHTSTHGAFGALAFGIGTSEVEHVLATQTLPQMRPKTMSINVEGELPAGSTAKDIILAIIGKIGTGGGIGSMVEYRGSAIQALSMEGRMTICNMSIEAGAKAGMIAPDDTTFAYVEGRAHAPMGIEWERALDDWRSLPTDEGASFDHYVEFDAATITPYVSWGTNPGQVIGIDGRIPNPETLADAGARDAAERALAYMNLKAGTPIRDIAVDTIFIGSCTNSRIEDLRLAAGVVAGKQVKSGLRAMVVPGSMRVKAQAEAEGLDRIFTDAGFEWRSAGCSMCLGMNPDILSPGERCASTSNRNFEGRQGKGGGHISSLRLSPLQPQFSVRSRHQRIWGKDMKPVKEITGMIAPLDRSDVDTDQIIPASYLKRVERTGFGEGLFAAWRANDPDFVLNKDEFKGAKILVADSNFGTGSSREHAVWALMDYGFEAVISPRFGDIFRNNSTKAGLIPVQVDQDIADLLLKAAAEEPGLQMTIDVVNRTLSVPEIGVEVTFPLDDFTQYRLVNGLDDIGLTLKHQEDISVYESSRRTWLPKTLATA